MKIPPGTQNGHVFRLKGKGIPSLHTSGKGDLLVRIKVLVPTKLTERQKQLLREFAEISGEKRSKGIFEKVKERI
jgi:molecular chaperone DnaJ